MYIRPMRHEDVAEVERLSDTALLALGRRTRVVGDPEPVGRPPDRRELWRARTHHLVDHDGDGCWVAQEDDRLLGATTSLRRETLWGLSSFSVRDGVQGRGVGRELLQAALGHSQGCVRGILCSSTSVAALRRYHEAGFALHPTSRVVGEVDRTLLPVVEDVRSGTASDLDLLESVDRRTRGAGHGVDHTFMAQHHRLLVADNHLGSGYCYLSGGGIYLLAATSERLAQRLTWEAMARTQDEVFTVSRVTSEQTWLVDVAMQARLNVRLDAYLAVRFMAPPWPYVPSPHFM